MNYIYTGIGSRSTPQSILDKMVNIAKALAGRGYTLRSGAADGADSAFEKGCDLVCGPKEIYLPARKFNNSKSILYHVGEDALELASTIHPAWDKCSGFAKLLHARNCYQVLGKDLKTPSLFVVCWTENGKAVGGTATAINLAIKNNIPVFNLALMDNIKDKVLEIENGQKIKNQIIKN
jgi:hypothetical protein